MQDREEALTHWQLLDQIGYVVPYHLTRCCTRASRGRADYLNIHIAGTRP